MIYTGFCHHNLQTVFRLLDIWCMVFHVCCINNLAIHQPEMRYLYLVQNGFMQRKMILTSIPHGIHETNTSQTLFHIARLKRDAPFHQLVVLGTRHFSYLIHLHKQNLYFAFVIRQPFTHSLTSLMHDWGEDSSNILFYRDLVAGH